MANRPSVLFQWCTAGQNLTQPADTLITSGWGIGAKNVGSQNVNWMFASIAGWIAYHDAEIQTLYGPSNTPPAADWGSITGLPADLAFVDKIQSYSALQIFGPTGTADDKTGAPLQATSISEGGSLLAKRYLGIAAQATDSAKLGGQLPSYYLPATAQAVDSAKLGGQAPANYAAASAVSSLQTRVNGLVTYGDEVVIPKIYTNTVQYTTDSNGYFNTSINSPTIDLTPYLSTVYGAIATINYNNASGPQASWGYAWVEIGAGNDNVPVGHIRNTGFCQAMANMPVTVGYLVFGS